MMHRSLISLAALLATGGALASGAGATAGVRATLTRTVPTLARHSRCGFLEVRDASGRLIRDKHVFVRITCPEGDASTTAYANPNGQGAYVVSAIVPPGGAGVDHGGAWRIGLPAHEPLPRVIGFGTIESTSPSECPDTAVLGRSASTSRREAGLRSGARGFGARQKRIVADAGNLTVRPGTGGVIDFWESRQDFDAFQVRIRERIAASGVGDAGTAGHQGVPGPRDHPALSACAQKPSDVEDVDQGGSLFLIVASTFAPDAVGVRGLRRGEPGLMLACTGVHQSRKERFDEAESLVVGGGGCFCCGCGTRRNVGREGGPGDESDPLSEAPCDAPRDGRDVVWQLTAAPSRGISHFTGRRWGRA